MSLTKFALITFLIGLLALFFLSNSLEPKPVKISDINSKMIDQYVKIQGNIIKIKQTDAATLITLNDETGSISVFSQKINISENSTIEVIGKVKDYKGLIEIESEKISAKY